MWWRWSSRKPIYNSYVGGFMKKAENKEVVKRALNKKQRMYVIITIIVVIIAALIVAVFLLSESENPGIENEPVNENFTFLLEGESTLIKNDDIFAGQMDLMNDIMNEYNDGNYDLDDPYVVVNPFLLSPQSALVMFETRNSEKVTVTLKGKHGDDLVTTFEASKDHYLPIYGLYGNYENELVIETESGDSNTITIKVDEELDTGAVEVLENNVTNSNGEFYFATSSLGVASIAYDNYGEVRWWLNIGYTKGMTMLQNGSILLSSANEGPDITSTSGVVEVDMLGFVHHEYEIEGGYHHDAYELPSGNLIILTSKLDSGSFADHIVEIDRETGKVIKSWNLRDIVTAIDANLIQEGEISWGWINSVYYDEKSDSLILSVRNQNSVVAIGYSDSKLKWILGDEEYWTNAFDDYILTGTGDNFIYPAGQHSVAITDDGYLSIFNNGYDANNEEAVTCASIRNNESYAMLYNLDLNAMTAEVVWSYGGNEYFSYALSSFTYATNGHKVFNSGWHFTDEVDFDNPECTQFSNDKYDAYIIDFDENNNVAVSLHIDESKFEVVKAPIYNLSAVSVKPTENDEIANYEVEMGTYLTTYADEEFETLTEEEALAYATNEDCFISFQMYNNRFKLLGAVPEEMDMRVTFISTRGVAYRYTMKEANGELKDFINLSGLPEGRYYVYVNMGDYVYNTTEYIEIK